jgi:hypothetical protein
MEGSFYPRVSEYFLQNGMLAGFGFLLVILALWYYTRTRSRVGIKSNRMAMSTAIKCPPRFKSEQTSSVVTASPMTFGKEVSEVDLMLEEAELYANHGHPATAVKIAQEIIKLDPSKSAAWSLLLSSYSSLGKAVEFEEAAREFLKHHKDSLLWGRIQALGRTLDQDNPLYAGNDNDSPALLHDAAPRRTIGDILIEMGVLSEETLLSWLDTFDPKKHGRFGGYLLTYKVITLEQLNNALLLQQAV